MITTPTMVVLSPALERYLWVDRLDAGAIHRPSRVEVTAGGKGLHVALAARRLGLESIRLAGVVGGATGEQIKALSARQQMVCDWTQGSRDTRVCTCIVDEAEQTMTEFYEAATPVTDSEWAAFTEGVSDGVPAGSGAIVALSGTVPGSVAPRDFARFVRRLRERGAVTMLDTGLVYLAAALECGPDWVKVNADEARAVCGSGDTESIEGIDQLARELRDRGARNAVVTAGPRGSVAALDDGAVVAVSAPVVERGMAVGSGDCYLAGLVVALSRGEGKRGALRLGTAAAAANASAPLVATFSDEALQRAMDAIVLAER